MKQGYIVGGIGVLVIGIGIILSIPDSKNNKQVDSDAESAQVGQEIEIQEAAHIEDGAQHAPYNSNPPTSGPHYVQPAAWGIYDKELPDEQLIHNEEHGGIWISYKDIDSETMEKLNIIGKSNPGSVVVTPRAANDSKIALASWGRLEKLDTYDEAKILEFIKANKNKSPEPIAR